MCISFFNNVSLVIRGGQWGEPNSRGVVAVSQYALQYELQVAMQIKANNIGSHSTWRLPLCQAFSQIGKRKCLFERSGNAFVSNHVL
ncbi:hypothetical protein [Microcoleus sp. CAWBG58]|uniref:hypothetical protein n=1 Tax=Microcoleus sp. CAWBG58 TaxID=2841651 RepID=UPI0026010068|nr:hypothetical protein [Microcoleus sp. CAWBG58]